MKKLTILLMLCSLFSHGQILQQSSFESAMPGNYTGACTASYSPWSCIEGSNATYSHQISTLYKRSGASSWRTELRVGDPPVPYGSYRTEMTMISKGQAVSANANCYGISIYIPASGSAWVNLSQDRITGMQSHPWFGTTTNGSPNWSIHTKSGRWQMWIVHTGSNTSITAPQIFLTPIDMGPVEYDVWTDWEVYSNDLKTPSGRIIANKVVNGVRTNNVCNYTGYALHGFSDKPFVKMGTYDWNINSSGGSPRIVYYDMARYGRATETTFSSVIGLTGPGPSPNLPPVVTTTASTSYSSGTTSAPLTAAAIDPEGGSMTYLWTQTAGTTSAISNPTTLSATATGLTNGNTYSYQIKVTDNQGAITTASRNIIIAAANVPPTVTMGGNQSLAVGATSGTITATSADSDGTLTGGIWSQLSGPNTATITSQNDVTPATSSTTVTGLIVGTYTFKFEVTDNIGAKASGTVTVTVPYVNQVPIVTPAPPYVLVRTGTSTSIAATAVDPESEAMTYLWSQNSGPNTAVITSGTTLSPTVSGLTRGLYVFKIVVTDASGGAAQTIVTVQVNNPPIVLVDTTLSATFAKTITSVIATGTATDTDGSIDSVRWSIVDGPSIPTITNGSTLTSTFSNLQVGSYIVRLTAYDNDGSSSSDDYNFTIIAGYLIISGTPVLKH